MGVYEDDSWVKRVPRRRVSDWSGGVEPIKWGIKETYICTCQVRKGKDGWVLDETQSCREPCTEDRSRVRNL